MCRALQFGLILGLLIVPAVGWGQIALVRSTTCGPATFPGTVCTIPATGSGNLIVIGWQIGGGASTSTTISSVSDNAGNVYSAVSSARAIDASPGSVAELWYAKNTNSGATSVTITPNAGISNAGVVIWEFSGADRTSPLDGGAALNSQPSSASVAAGAPVTTSAGGAIVSLASVGGTVTGISSGNPFVNIASLKGDGWAHAITTGAGTYAASWTMSPGGTSASSTAAFRGTSAGVSAPSGGGTFSACDLNQSGGVNVVDGQLAVNMSLGLMPCTANIAGAGVCNVTVVQRVVNSALGQQCVVDSAGPVSHTVQLNWTGSTSASISGYNVYRGTASGGPYPSKLNTGLITGTTFTDTGVQSGLTYYYVVTAVDSSNAESSFSNQTVGAIPTP